MRAESDLFKSHLIYKEAREAVYLALTYRFKLRYYNLMRGCTSALDDESQRFADVGARTA